MSSYDAFAREYAAHAAASPYNAKYERPAMQGRLGDVRGKRVLDAACAAGEHAALLLERGAYVVAVDTSAALIGMVGERFGDAVETHCADLREPLTFLPADSIDIVFSSLTMHYLEDWTVALREFARVLVPGGRVLISTHHPAMTAPLVNGYFETQLVCEKWRIGERDVDVQFYHRSLETIVAAIVGAGFIVDAIAEPHLMHPDPAIPAVDYERLSSEPWFIIVDAHAA